METPYLGEIFALLAAMTWATALVLFKRSGETVGPLSLSLFKTVIATAIMGVTLVFTRGGDPAIFADPSQRITDLSPRDVAVLLASGTIGIAIADTILFYALNLIGVGLVTVAECSYSPAVMFVAWLMIGERLDTHHLVGGGMVLSGLLLSSTHEPPPDRTRRQLLWGSACAVFAIALMALGIVWAKPILERVPLLPATMLRLVGGTVVLSVILAAHPNRRGHFAVFRPTKTWKTMVPASILGTYLAMIFWVGGFKYTSASTAAVINQTSTIFALLLAAVILREKLTARKLVAAGLAFAGVAVVMGLIADQR